MHYLTFRQTKKLQFLAKRFGVFSSILVLTVFAAVHVASAASLPSFSERYVAILEKRGISTSSDQPYAGAKGFPEIQPYEPRVLRSYLSQVTVYHSVPWETDGDPFTTASGTTVHDGTVAANCLPFGTKLRIPELFGEKVFTVEDRLAPRKSCYVIDIWKEYNPNDRAFGAPLVSIEILQGSPRTALAHVR